MKKRVLVGVGVAAVAGVLLWPRHAKKDAPLEPSTQTSAPGAGGTAAGPEAAGPSAKRHPRPVIDETKRRQMAELGRVLRALPEAEAGRTAEDEAARKAGAAAPTADATLDRAKQAFEAAYDLYNAKRYGDAAEGFLAAYDLVPYPELLFNAAVAFEKADDCRPALEYLERYLVERVDQAPDARVDERLAGLRRRCGP